MRQWNLDIALYDAGALNIVNDLINAGKLTWMPDEQALEATSWYLVLEALDHDLEINFEAMQTFLLHAQRACKLNGEFVEGNFCAVAHNVVPDNPPIAPETLELSVVGNTVTGTAPLGQFCDRYEWQGRLHGEGAWLDIGAGTVSEATVTFQYSGVPAGTHQFRVVVRWGFFPGFPGDPAEITVP